MNMNITERKISWSQTKGRLKQKIALLKDHDLMLEEGNESSIISQLQSKLNKTREEIIKIISEL